MTARKWYLLPVVLVAVVMAMPLAIRLWAPRGSGSGINRENCKRIQVGMTLAQVEEIMGGPARSEVTAYLDVVGDELTVYPGPGRVYVSANGAVNLILDDGDRMWASDDAFVWLVLDDDGRVKWVESYDVRPVGSRPTAMERLHRWLRSITG
jgi:hypothetical protein